MKKKKTLITLSVLFIILLGAFTFFAYNKAQEANQQKAELAQKKTDKENKEKQKIILAEKTKLENEKKKLEEEQKAKQDELDRLQAEKDSISQEAEQPVQQEQSQQTEKMVIQNETASHEETQIVESPKQKLNANGQTIEERRQELTDKMNNGDNSIGYREILNIINSEFP